MVDVIDIQSRFRSRCQASLNPAPQWRTFQHQQQNHHHQHQLNLSLPAPHTNSYHGKERYPLSPHNLSLIPPLP